jgi:hypothetical protein
MRKFALCRSKQFLAGWALFLIFVFLHPLIMESFDHSHRDHCSFCLHFSSIGIVLPAFSFLPFLIFLGYALAIPLRKLASRFFLISSGRAPPALF